MTLATASSTVAFNTAPISHLTASTFTPSRSTFVPRLIRHFDTSLHATFIPANLTTAQSARVNAIVCSTRFVKRGATLYRAGDAFTSLYAVRTGCFKTVVVHRHGDEQVTGFHMAGDPLALDGVCSDEHNCDAVALEDSTVCVVPFALLENLCQDMKAIQHHIHRMMSGEIVREAGLMMMLGTMTAEQRVAAFLMNLATRMKARGYSGVEFNLRMTREEIGNYLGLKLETVSRTLSKLQKEGVVGTSGKQIRIIDDERLASAGCPVTDACSRREHVSQTTQADL
ncbi:helix-turn-helix domain-containing protein [Caballeronia sp. LjRoot34]|uniref:helix-turn-helix domain-containing protein n=1 Tax=Caballeronia sp. LjRoot34 TaxID=3342325 RepID=UPI003ECF0E1F